MAAGLSSNGAAVRQLAAWVRASGKAWWLPATRCPTVCWPRCTPWELATLAASFVALVVSEAAAQSDPGPAAIFDIELRDIAVIGAASDPASPTLSARAAIIGPWIVTGPMYERGYLYVYDRGGRFQRRIGGSGEGPGEFGRLRIVSMHVSGDSLYVLGVGGPRVHVFTRDLDLAREARLPTPAFDFAPVANVIALNPLLVSQGPLVIADWKGRRVAEITDQDDAVRQTTRAAQTRYLHESAEGVWEQRETEYRLRLIDPERKEVTRRLDFERDWFPPLSDEAQRKRVFAGGIWEDSGYLWVLFHVYAQDGWPAFGEPSTPAGLDAWYDTIIEVIDIQSGTVVAAARDPRRIERATGGLMSHLRETQSGDHRLALLRPVLRTKPVGPGSRR